jgi:hypothetical protein
MYLVGYYTDLIGSLVRGAKVHTVVTIVRGKDVLLDDAPLQVVPRAGESLNIRDWRCKVLKVEHNISENPDVHSVRVFVR